MSIDVDRLVSEIEVDPSKAIAGLKAYDTALNAASRDRSSDIDLDLGSAMSELVLFDSRMTVATRDRTVNIDVDRGGQATGALSSIASAAGSAGSALADAGGNGSRFGGIIASAFSSGGSSAGIFTAMIAGTVAGLAPLILAGIAIGSILPGAFAAAAAGAGILLAALVPLVGLLGALPAMIGGLGLVGGALIGGLAGVIGGVSAYKDATAGAGAATEDLTAKQNALRSAQQGLATAIHQVTQAQQALKDAQEDMAKAPLEAAEAIEDAHFRNRQAIISEQRAILNLRDAQNALSDAQNEAARSSLDVTQQTDEFTGKVYDVAVETNDAVDAARDQKDALLAVQQAQLDLATAQDETGDSARYLREMEKKGIKNSDIMVAATRALADAQWNLKQAHQGVANAQRNVAQAQKNMAAGAAGATAATKAWDDAQKKLSATGIDFVKFLADEFMPAFSDIGKVIQDTMLPGIKGGLEIVLDYTDEIGQELGIVGGMIGDTFEEFMKFWTLPDQKNLLSSMFGNLNDSIQAGLDLLRPFSRVMAHITDAAAPMLTKVFEGIGGWLDDIADKWDQKGGKNGLVQFFDDAQYFGGLWWDVLEGIWAVLEPIVNAGKPLAAKWLKGLAGDLEDMGDYLASPKGQKMLTKFFEDAVPALKQTWKFITGIADVLFNSSEGGTDSGFYKFMKAMNDDFVPAIKTLFEDLDGSDLAGDLVSIFTTGVEFANALNDSGFLKAVDAISGLLALGANGNPWRNIYPEGAPEIKNNDARDYDEYTDRGYTPDTTSWQKLKDDLKDIWKGPEEGSPIDKKLDDLKAKISDTFSMDNISIQFQEFLFGDSLGDIGERWGNFFDGIGSWASDTWTGIKQDFKDQWKSMTSTLSEEKEIWKDRIEGFNDWLDKFSWSNVWDGLVDAFYTAMEWVADAWNATLGGLSVDIPGVGKFTIPELNVGDVGAKPGSPGHPDYVAPTQPTPGDRNGQTDTGMGAQNDRVVVNQTFNTPIDPKHVADELGWRLAG